MQKLVLGAGINPRVCKSGPRVRLAAGRYRLCVEHLVDTMLGLRAAGALHFSDSDFESKGEIFSFEIIKAGTESYINIFAELISGPILTTVKG